jgi:oxygen-independent coproporphyrinogen-3 oxidase
MKTFSLYIHIPFCEKKCIYCDFYSLEKSEQYIDDYIEALNAEIDIYSKDSRFANGELSTIFFGGGTPSILEPEQIDAILQKVFYSFKFAPDIEITLEANPGTVSKNKLTGYIAGGINRLSFGVQSFYEDELKFLSRIHNSEQAIEGYKLARDSGFRNINLDFIFALPNQTTEKWKMNLQKAIELSPEHLSTYSLIVEPNTPLFKMIKIGRAEPVDEERDAEMYKITIETLEKAGYEHYEISNFAKPGFRSRHNFSYWEHLPYLGLGTSSHSFDGENRFWNVRDLKKYIANLSEGKLAIDGQEKLNNEQLIFESIFLGLRKREGLNIDRFQKKFGVDFLDRYKKVLDSLDKEFFILKDNFLKLTEKGLFVCDKICEEFVI